MKNIYDKDLPDWLKSFADDLASDPKINSTKTIVDVSRNRGANYYQQIDSILQNKTSVEHVVKELQNRIGLTDYLNIISADQNAKKKQASQSIKFEDLSGDEKNEIYKTIDYHVNKYYGSNPIAIQSHLIESFPHLLNPEIINSTDLLKIIVNKIEEYNKQHPYNESNELVYNIDEELEEETNDNNDDVFSALTPSM